MTPMTRIEINPNLRIDGDYTIADLDEDIYGALPKPLETVEVFESSSGLQGRGWVTHTDQEERTVTLLVDWANLMIPTTSATSGRSSVANLSLHFRARPGGVEQNPHREPDVHEEPIG